MLSGNFKTAVINLRMARWRSIFTMLGIIIGISSVLTIISLGEGLKHQIVGRADRFGADVITVRPGKLTSAGQTKQKLNLLSFLSTSTLTSQDVSSLQKTPSVGSVVPLDFVTASAKGGGNTNDNVSVLGTSPDMAGILNNGVEYGRFFDTDAPDQNYAVIGPQVARHLFGELNAVGQTITIMGQDFIVEGVLQESFGGLLAVSQTDFNSAVMIPFSAATTMTHGRTNILQIFVTPKNPIKTDAAIADIRGVILKNHQGQEDFSVIKQQELINLASGVVDTATGLISGIAGISLLVGGIGIMAIMLVSVSERTREIGIRKAVGATNRQILHQFLVEGLVLTLGGGLIGLVVALALNVLLRIYTSWQPIISLPLVLLTVGLLIAIGIVFSAAPALKAARKDPINALRSE